VHAFIVSDLHLGSSETKYDQCVGFIDSLPDGAMLVLNGDTANDATKHEVCEEKGRQIFERIRQESLRRPVVWLSGNNDTGYRPESKGRIEYRSELAIGKDLYVCHGHRFLTFPSDTQSLQKLLHAFCDVFHRDRGRTLHMADYLQRLPPLYRLACWLVARGAIRFARRNGYSAITCGHTHRAEEVTAGDVTYFNTGAWSAAEPHCLEVTESGPVLRRAATTGE
jgi:UDP-2,3-diacylglucosamine pyrophosphatase LpxH